MERKIRKQGKRRNQKVVLEIRIAIEMKYKRGLRIDSGLVKTF